MRRLRKFPAKMNVLCCYDFYHSVDHLLVKGRRGKNRGRGEGPEGKEMNIEVTYLVGGEKGLRRLKYHV